MNNKKIMTWHEALELAPLLLPVAHDALTSKLIKKAGFTAYQIGGFALEASQFAYPDIGLTDFGDTFDIIRQIISVSDLPVLVDAGSGYGDVKRTTRVIQEYEKIGADAIFIEDQAEPIRCGHMQEKKVISADDMVKKIKAAIHARQNKSTFILARTDARDAISFDEALIRAQKYFDAGADGVYFEGLHNFAELEKAGKEFKGQMLAMSILENGGETPWIDPRQLHKLGFSMILYPTTIIFNVVDSIKKTLNNLIQLNPIDKHKAVNFNEFEQLLNLTYWQHIENKYK